MIMAWLTYTAIRLVLILCIACYMVSICWFLIWAWFNRPKVDPKWRP